MRQHGLFIGFIGNKQIKLALVIILPRQTFD